MGNRDRNRDHGQDSENAGTVIRIEVPEQSDGYVSLMRLPGRP